MIWFYRVGFSFDCIALLYILYNFFDVFAGQEMSLLIIMLILGGIIGLGYYLQEIRKQLAIATIIIWIPMIPIILYLGFLLLVIGLSPDFK